MIYTRTNIILTASAALVMRNIGQVLNPNETAGMFATGLSPTGETPATHFISCGEVPQSFAQAIRSPDLLDMQAQAAFAKVNIAYPYSLAIVAETLAACTVSDGTYNALPESPFEMMARLGLQMVRATI